MAALLLPLQLKYNTLTYIIFIAIYHIVLRVLGVQNELGFEKV